MKTFLLILTLCCFAPSLQGQNAPAAHSRDSITVYIFLGEECVICRYYTLTLRQLHQEFGDRVQFTGIFPNPSSKRKKIAAFKEKYQLPFDLKMDAHQILTKKMGARITPEAVVFHASSGEILYRGRIDDAYIGVGNRRSAVTASELRDALRAILENRKVPVKSTEAVGCFIEMKH